MIVVATEDFELYHEVLAELRDRDLQFSTVKPGADLPPETTVVITDSGSVPFSTPVPEDVERVLARPEAPDRPSRRRSRCSEGRVGRSSASIPANAPGSPSWSATA